MRNLMGIVAFAALLAACGKPNPGNTCRRQVAISCKRAFECNRAQAETVYGNEASCSRSLDSFCAQLDNYECDDLTAYERCVSDYATVSCAALSSFSCPANFLSTCRMTGTGGRAVCQNTNVNSQSTTCSVTLSNCTDGRSYLLSCSGSNCTCNDGASTRSVTSSCSSKEAAISVCGWNVQ